MTLSRSVRLALALSALLFGLRWLLAHRVGLADAEALYVSYALHPQPAYLDHPGLVGTVARLVGEGTAPSPEAVHRFTAIATTLLPWFGALMAIIAGARRDDALKTFFALALVPEIAIGLFALNPDLLLVYAWLATLGLGALALRSPPRSLTALLALLGAGLAAGLATLAKASGVLVLLACVIGLLSRPARPLWRTAGPWATLGVVALLVAPVVGWELDQGFPLLRHRLIATQADAGFSLRNLGALLGGQLLYLTPPFLIAAALLAHRLAKLRHSTAVEQLFWHATWLPAAFLALLCLWSPVAEPHWMAPAYLALALFVARVPEAVGRRTARVSAVTGFAVIAVAWGWVATPLPVKLFGDRYVARYDVSNDLYAWAPGIELVEQVVEQTRRVTGRTPVVVGPHYIVCAQVHAALELEVPVGCRTPTGDDFDRWYPRPIWHEAPTILFVHDDRFDIRPEAEFPKREVRQKLRTTVIRGGRPVRTITVTRLDRVEATA